MSNEIASQVKDIIAEKFGTAQEKVVDSANFIEDLGADSLDTAELVMTLEDKFDITIPDEDATKIQTVKDAVDYIVSKK
jgi:acyl carrier protein